MCARVFALYAYTWVFLFSTFCVFLHTLSCVSKAYQMCAPALQSSKCVKYIRLLAHVLIHDTDKKCWGVKVVCISKLVWYVRQRASEVSSKLIHFTENCDSLSPARCTLSFLSHVVLYVMSIIYVSTESFIQHYRQILSNYTLIRTLL